MEEQRQLQKSSADMKAPKKTWAREAAFAMFLGCAYLAYNGQIEELNIVIWPTTIFGLSAFGFKQPSVDSWMRGKSSQSTNGWGS